MQDIQEYVFKIAFALCSTPTIVTIRDSKSGATETSTVRWVSVTIRNPVIHLTNDERMYTGGYHDADKFLYNTEAKESGKRVQWLNQNTNKSATETDIFNRIIERVAKDGESNVIISVRIKERPINGTYDEVLFPEKPEMRWLESPDDWKGTKMSGEWVNVDFSCFLNLRLK